MKKLSGSVPILTAFGLLFVACGESPGSGGVGAGSAEVPENPVAGVVTPAVVDEGSGDPDIVVPPAEIDSPACQMQDVVPESGLARRLTHRELVNSLRDILGIDLSVEAAELTPDRRESGFKNLSVALNVPYALAEQYREFATRAVQAVPDWNGLIALHAPCQELVAGCIEPFVASLGRRMFRQPLVAEQQQRYGALFQVGSDSGGGFKGGAELILEAMVQAPQFLYRTERAAQGPAGSSALSDYEVASRLSFSLWGSAPDAVLLDQAGAGRLTSSPDVAAQVKRMLQDEHFREQLWTFVNQWLDVEGISSVPRDPVRYPGFEELRDDFIAESEQFVTRVLWEQQSSINDLFHQNFTIASEALARFYGFDARPGTNEYVFEDGPRSGILTHGSVLGVHGRHDQPSLVERGLFVYRDVLCFDVFQAPPDIVTAPIEVKPGQTQRTAALDRVAVPACAGCHLIFDPLAFPFERFDGAGRYAEQDEFGNALEANGTLIRPITEEPVTYQSTTEFTAFLAQSSKVSECITKKALQFAFGRVLGPQDQCLIDTLHSDAFGRGGTFAQLMTAIVLHPAYRSVSADQ